MAVGDAHVFPSFLSPVLTQLFVPKPPITFLACFCRGERLKYAGKKVRLNRGSNSKPPDHESDTFTTEPPGQGLIVGVASVTVLLWPVIAHFLLTLVPKRQILDSSRLKKTLQTTISNLIKIAESSLIKQKTQWEKEKLLVTSNFSFFHNVFKRLVLQTRTRLVRDLYCRHEQGLFAKGSKDAKLQYRHLNEKLPLSTLNSYFQTSGPAFE